MGGGKGMYDTRDDILRDLFFKDYTNLEMQTKLHYKGISMSSRSIKRHLRRLGLRQRGRWSTQEIVTAIQEERKGSGQNLGYRSLTKRLLTKHGMAVGRKSVSSILRQIDPKGVELRTHHCLIRRTYYNKGPNFLVHIDGYDKLKPFGLAIHGAICGFSRRVLWLKVARTNNDPRVVASYFLDFVEEIHVLFLNQNDLGVPRCILTRQPEECPSGKPEMMYLHPELYGTVDYKFSVKLSDVESLKSFCSYPSCYGCTEEMKEHFTSILLEGRRSEPINSEDAKELFQWMLQKI
ncbi:uncharacterized protein LOC117327204 isoform X2 [Pecten maximus]|uniref:uncharacterized protein LOC117327204 isoform X2 n=1 Tax=Pecten maximus TaxID=6579 RepID=UPI001458C2D9|nr:uncharacterized protein LOC117327204 isoform X2 [Pecten maximus]